MILSCSLKDLYHECLLLGIYCDEIGSAGQKNNNNNNNKVSFLSERSQVELAPIEELAKPDPSTGQPQLLNHVTASDSLQVTES